MQMKNRIVDTVHVVDCPMHWENCLCGCPFYCGWTEKVTEPIGATVMCGWSKEMQAHIENNVSSKKIL